MRAIVLLILSALSVRSEDELTLERYRQLIARYHAGAFRNAALELSRCPLEAVHSRNDELPRAVDVSRPDEARTLRAAILLNAEAAVSTLDPARADFFLDESVSLSTALAVGDAVDLQKRVHLAAAHRLYAERRVSDAIRVLAPAASRFPEDAELCSSHGGRSSSSPAGSTVPRRSWRAPRPPIGGLSRWSRAPVPGSVSRGC